MCGNFQNNYLHICIDFLSNNTVLCSYKKVGYSKNKYIKNYSTWEYSIDIIFDIEDMHSTDLYLILFSYLRNQEVYCVSIHTIGKFENNIKIFSHQNSYEINKMTYREFESWWEYRQWYDSCLLSEKELYGIKLSFIPDLVDIFIKKQDISLEDFYSSYKPMYPWSDEIISYFDYFIDETNFSIIWQKSPKYRYLKKPIKH